MAENPNLPNADPSDAQWLAALAGSPDPAASIEINQQAAALRAAFQAEANEAMATLPSIDELRRRKMLLALRAEGLFPAAGTNPTQSRPTRYAHRPAWAAAASVVLALSLGVRCSSTDWTEGPTTRGGATLIVAHPAEMAAQLVAGLRAAQSDPSAYTWCDGTVDLTARVTDEAINFLMEDPWRLLPEVRQHELHLTLTPSTTPQCGFVGILRDRSHRLIKNLRWWVSTHVTTQETAPPAAPSRHPSPGTVKQRSASIRS